MNAVIIITVIFFALFIISAIPIIQLKYNHDVANYTEKMSYQCHKTEKKKQKVDLPEYHKYLYMISETLYDTKFDNKITPLSNSFEPPLHMKIYKQYSEFSYAFFLASWIGFICYFIIFFINYSREYIKLSLIFVLFLIVVGITIVFSLILKKITEIYNDTKITEYYDFMTDIKTALRDYRNKSPEQYKILSENILFENNSVHDLDTNYMKNIIFNNQTIHHLDKHLKIPKNRYYRFHNDKHTNLLKYKIDVVVSHLFAYFIMLIIFIFFIVKILKEYYYVNINILFMVIIISYILALILYYVIRYLH
jgi:hypothetical protein